MLSFTFIYIIFQHEYEENKFSYSIMVLQSLVIVTNVLNFYWEGGIYCTPAYTSTQISLARALSLHFYHSSLSGKTFL